MAYRALYRTYRPGLFSEVIGQKHVTVTLQNQIASGHVAHAYLFCGSRGTGKTSTAKIFARAVNCLSPVDGEPCGQCEACRLMLSGSTPDITEIDAASNNGVDNVRALIEQVHFSTLQLNTRVLIIDEVHMLSGSAFNALLKTLEEPPANTLFVLATTEPQKLPATIISRCQRFDFHRISIQDIMLNLRNVLKKAGASIDEEGLQLIARAADGGMRDALSLADQCLAFCGDTVTARDVYDVLGSMDSSFLFDFSSAILQGDTAKALRQIDTIVRGGRDLTVFTQDLAAHMRALMLAGTCGRCEDLLDCTADMMDRYLAEAKGVSQAKLLTAMQALLKAQSEMRYLQNPRAMLESTIVRICRPEDTRSLLAMEARIDVLERELAVLKSMPASRQPVATPAPAAYSAPVSPAAAAPAKPAAASSPVPQSPASVQSAATPVQAPAQPQATVPAAPQAMPTATAAGLWAEVLQLVKKTSPLSYAMALPAVAEDFSADILTIRFADKDDVKFKSTCAVSNRVKLEQALSSLHPGVKLSIIKGSGAPIQPAVIDAAKEMFGDGLTIEDT